MVVHIDKQTGDLVIDLPQEYEHYSLELKNSLYEEFAYEPLSKIVISRMNRFVDEWFQNKGINLPGEKNNENTD